MMTMIKIDAVFANGNKEIFCGFSEISCVTTALDYGDRNDTELESYREVITGGSDTDEHE